VDEDTQIDYLKAKVDAGADFIVTQLFYDADRFLSWYKKLRAKGIHFSDCMVSRIQLFKRNNNSCSSWNHANPDILFVHESHKALWSKNTRCYGRSIEEY